QEPPDAREQPALELVVASRRVESSLRVALPIVRRLVLYALALHVDERDAGAGQQLTLSRRLGAECRVSEHARGGLQVARLPLQLPQLKRQLRLQRSIVQRRQLAGERLSQRNAFPVLAGAFERACTRHLPANLVEPRARGGVGGRRNHGAQ